ncbi:MAG: EutN/CcmL family microcompartment protein [bacterium]|nr:EutN/CcmL family microcompartment protein [bacterium]
MILGRVIGRVVLSEAEEKLTGKKLIVFEPIDENLKVIGEPQVSIDTVGAGSGEIILLCEGDESMLSYPDPIPPGDYGIVGIVDQVDIQKKELKTKKGTA